MIVIFDVDFEEGADARMQGCEDAKMHGDRCTRDGARGGDVTGLAVSSEYD